MLKNVAGCWYESKPSPDEWVVRSVDLGNGHREATIVRPTVWEEVDPKLSRLLGDDWSEIQERDRAATEEERRQANLKRAARRAKTRVRHIVKVMGFDAMLTLTYRENQQDLALCKKHFKEFVRRMNRLFRRDKDDKENRFKYVAAFEPQKRGAWHVHMAIHALPRELPAANGVKVKSFRVVLAIWRGVVGRDNGAVHHKKRDPGRQSTAKLASYLSKYMLKAFEDGDDWSNRYSGSQGVEIPQSVRMRFRDCALTELIALVFDDLHTAGCELSTYLSRFGDVFFMSTSPPPIT